MTGTNDEIIQAVFTATDEAKARALAILRGEADPASALCPRTSDEAPLLLGMGEAAKLLGVSRATLWRMLRDGRLTKVEIYHNAFRLRRADILALVQGRAGSPSRPLSSNSQPQTSNCTPEVPRG
jgi:excisionase family DNA binding protein